MALYADRVKQSLGVTGTGTITLTLASTSTGYQSFLTAFGTGTQTIAYCIADQSGPNWEVGTGTYNGSANTLARTTVLASSNGGSLTNFSGGTQDVFCTAPAKYLDTFTSANQGVVPASGGGTSNFLRADGTFAAPPTTAPAGSNTQIQFNSSSAFGASANFTYNTGTNTFTVGPAGATTTIETLAPTGSTVAGTLLVRGKNASATNGNGGGFIFTPGNASGTGTGGGATFNTGTGRSGGNLIFTAANGTVFGGNVNFNSGNGEGATGTGGNFSMTAGLGSTTASGGNFEMTAGAAASSGAGGNFTMLAGGSVSGLGGEVTIASGFGVPSGSIYLGADSGTVIQITQDATPNLQLGFFSATPVAQQASAPVATNLATAITLVNALRTALLNLGLIV
jgi:hypothetical protein